MVLLLWVKVRILYAFAAPLWKLGRAPTIQAHDSQPALLIQAVHTAARI